ncbi:MAG: hypothetical protein Q4E18_04535 [Clostridia bacterium]|nr:hypothetical protein [Clostridia bacterium]
MGAALGGGGFGVTYRALKLRSLRPVQGETVAVKEYFPRSISARREDGSIEPNPREQENFDRWRSKFVQEYRMPTWSRRTRASGDSTTSFRTLAHCARR